MKRLNHVLTVGVLGALALASCGGKGSLPAPASGAAGTVPAYNGPAQLASFAWNKKLLTGAVLQGPANEQATVGMQVLVAQRDARGLVQYAKDVSDPHSANYRHFLTPEEIADRFGASQADYQAAAGYFAHYGIHASAWPQRQAIFVTGAIGQFERAFNTKFGVYTSGPSTFVAPMQAPHLTTAAPIAQIGGMVHVQLNRSYIAHPTNGQFRGYSPQQMQRAFDFSGAYSHGFTGAGINVAIIGTGPISSADVPELGSIFGATVAPLTQVDVTDTGVSAGLAASSPSPNPLPSAVSYPLSSGFTTPPPVTSPVAPACTAGNGLPSCNPEDIEAQLDTESVASLAPGSNVLFYLGYNANDCYYQVGTPQNNSACPAGVGVPAEGIALADAEIQQVIADDRADVVSMSYGLGEILGIAGGVGGSSGFYDAAGQGFGPVEMAAMVAEGMAVFVSSGDNGAYECGAYLAYYYGNAPCVSYPASDPNAVSVGGVTAPLNNDGTVQTQFTAWGDQTTGGGSGQFANDVGSGGGVSAVFIAPTWQVNAGLSSLTGGFRGQPDISMMADPNTGQTIVANAGFPGQLQVFPIGGTSAAAPEMAAMWALVLQACKSDVTCSGKGSGTHAYRLGNPAPLIYGIYQKQPLYGSTMYDVLYGQNGSNNAFGAPGAGYTATKGYDLVTGVGVPYAGHLINAVLTMEGSNASWNLP